MTFAVVEDSQGEKHVALSPVGEFLGFGVISSVGSSRKGLHGPDPGWSATANCAASCSTACGTAGSPEQIAGRLDYEGRHRHQP